MISQVEAKYFDKFITNSRILNLLIGLMEMIRYLNNMNRLDSKLITFGLYLEVMFVTVL